MVRSSRKRCYMDDHHDMTDFSVIRLALDVCPKVLKRQEGV